MSLLVSYLPSQLTDEPLAWTAGRCSYFAPRFASAPQSLQALVYAHESVHVLQRRHGKRLVDPQLAGHPIYRQMIELDAAIGSLAVLAGRKPQFTLPDDPDRIAEWGPAGHYWTTLCVMLAAGVPIETAKKVAFFCQMPDQVLEFDAIAAAVDFTSVSGGNYNLVAPLAGSEATTTTEQRIREGPGDAVRRRQIDYQISTGLHCLTGRNATQEVGIRYREALRHARDPVVFGLALHCFGDSYAHQDDAPRPMTNPIADRRMGNEPLPPTLVPAPGSVRMFPPLVGHAASGHTPDLIGEHSGQYRDYVSRLYSLAIEAFGQTPRMDADRVVTALGRVAGGRFGGSDTVIEGQQCGAINYFMITNGWAPLGAFEDYRPELERICRWNLFHPRHAHRWRPKTAEAIFATARQWGASWSRM
jgi:hypothetical protein